MKGANHAKASRLYSAGVWYRMGTPRRTRRAKIRKERGEKNRTNTKK